MAAATAPPNGAVILPRPRAEAAARPREMEAWASAARQEAAVRLAALGLSLARGTDLRYVAAALTGAAVEPWSNLADTRGRRLAGLLERVDNVLRIRFEAHDPPGRQRFSIAHEAGHVWLHLPALEAADALGRGQHACLSAVVGSDDEEHEADPGAPAREREANAFAGAFLMPADELVGDLARFGRCAAFLGARYGVSAAAMRTRLRTLGRLGLLPPVRPGEAP
jgi:hypothetical protein